MAARTHAITQYLREQHDIKALVVACNTATAAAIHEVRSSHPDLLSGGGWSPPSNRLWQSPRLDMWA